MTTATPLNQPAADGQPTLVDVLPQHRIDEAAVGDYLRAFLPARFDGQVRIRQFQGGQSNPTYHLATNVGEWVLRKKPPGKLLPSAHAVEREYRVMHALRDSGVPVPNMLCLCEDPAVLGTPFFVMQNVPGRLLGARFVANGTAEEKAAIYDDLVRVLAELHRADWQARGLTGFGKPERFLERQVSRWAAQWDASRTEDVPAMDELRAWLPKHLPAEDETSLVHGDYRLGNVLIAPHEPKLAAVLDWELATLGHPLADLGYLCLMYHLPPHEGGVRGSDLSSLGVPTQAELVATYARYAQREVPKNLDVFIVFSLFRLAGILAGVYKRALDGNAADSRALQQGDRYRAVAELGWELAQRYTA